MDSGIERVFDREDYYRRRRMNWMISQERRDEFANGDRTPDVPLRTERVIDREDYYRRRRMNWMISQERRNEFANADRTPDVSVRTYADVMREEALKRKKEEILKLIADKQKKGA